nr:esterase FrsA [Rhodothermaceae bacterium]
MTRITSYLLYAILSFAFPELGFSQNQWTTEEMTVESRGARLAGTLYLPTGQGPHPVMIGVHGSGYVDRSDLYQGEAARYFAERGVAFFMYDKRGVGESSGTYPGSYSSSMVIYAIDALAAADLMASRDDI